MTTEWGSVVDRWDEFMEILSAQPRRQIVVSLLDVPDERRVPLPDAALTSGTDIDPESFTIALQHTHLPKLAESEYVRWERDPFCVQRGPRFEEVAAVMRVLLSAETELPSSLRAGCVENQA